MPPTDSNSERRAPAADRRAERCRVSPFKLARIEKTRAPEGGGAGRTWYRYVLDNGRSIIIGQRCGTLKEVTAYAMLYAERLNARAVNGQSAWSPRAKKPA